LKKVPATKSTTTYNFMFSTLGGEDHKRAAEWMQDQWSKNAHLKTNLIAKENKVFLSELQKNPPPLFRKGVALDRPTCLAALENFGPPNPENYVALKSVEFEKILDQLSKASKKHEQKNLCLAGVQFLMNHHLLIPMGAMHFAILASEEFSGWKLNQMNQLDLSQLHAGP
ncbi:MAG TPA: hypothetical protein VN132_13275, partial [Bdellovibrio sp.]|nr:hypothetical protein [Bdellovibrio sp.]